MLSGDGVDAYSYCLIWFSNAPCEGTYPICLPRDPMYNSSCGHVSEGARERPAGSTCACPPPMSSHDLLVAASYVLLSAGTIRLSRGGRALWVVSHAWGWAHAVRSAGVPRLLGVTWEAACVRSGSWSCVGKSHLPHRQG